jgi:protoporphyrinogen oxidase
LDDPRQTSTAIIIGAGPAGLTAAFELLARTEIRPVVLEMSEHMGGISRTVNYKGNRIDIGGHRFFSKSDRVMEWWFHFLPLEKIGGDGIEIAYRGSRRRVDGWSAAAPDSAREDRVMLLRSRLSRIYFHGKFFAYPISISLQTVRNLGVVRTVWIGISYVRAALFPIRPEKSLEDFFINRFGRQLYFTFFKSYTEKVWGVPCRGLSADWGAQRVKGLSIWKALAHVARGALPARSTDILQKKTETSLIEKFFYPKFGPGQMWEEVARQVREQQGEILSGWRVDRIEHESLRVTAVDATHRGSGEKRRFQGDVFFSTMPVKELIAALDPPAPAAIREVADGLVYRDFITVGLLCARLTIQESGGGRIKDNWIYIHEPGVLVGRLQIFNNWSPYLVSDPGKTWIGLEYFCDEAGSLWKKPDAEMIELAKDEMAKLHFVDHEDVLDATVVRMPKAYPAYFGSYDRFGELTVFTDRFENLFLIGRNGMHRYNNQDHSMLAAMTAVDNIVAGERSRANLWSLNTEMDYLEQKSEGDAGS